MQCRSKKQVDLNVQETAKRLDLSISPSLSGLKGNSTVKLIDLVSISKATTDQEPIIEKKGNTTAWNSLFAGNHSSENGLKFSYIPPAIVEGKVVLQLEMEDVDKKI